MDTWFSASAVLPQLRAEWALRTPRPRGSRSPSSWDSSRWGPRFRHVPLRFLTGFFLAGVYPPTVKVMATWYRSHERGTAVGILIGTSTIGYAMTVATIWLVPVVRDASSWTWAFAMLALGPALGIVSMLRLRASPEAALIAGGRG